MNPAEPNMFLKQRDAALAEVERMREVHLETLRQLARSEGRRLRAEHERDRALAEAERLESGGSRVVVTLRELDELGDLREAVRLERAEVQRLSATIERAVAALRARGRGPEGSGSNLAGLIYDEAADLVERLCAAAPPVTEHGYEWTFTVSLPAGTVGDPYDPDGVAEALRELADRVEREDLPPTGDLWDRTGRLLGRGRLVEQEEGDPS